MENLEDLVVFSRIKEAFLLKFLLVFFRRHDDFLKENLMFFLMLQSFFRRIPGGFFIEDLLTITKKAGRL